MGILPELERIPVLTDDPGWHGKRLKDAFALRRREAVFVSLKACHLEMTPGKLGVHIPGFDVLPPAVFVRGVPGGSVQQVIQRLNILHALHDLGVVVFNDGRAVERTVDKAMTSFLLHRHNIPTPPTWVCESREIAQNLIFRENMAGRSLVLKPLFGSQGQGVCRLESGMPFPVPMQKHVDGVYYLQSYIDSGEGQWHDYRVFVIGHRVVAAMVRFGNSWINNVAQGGRCEPYPLTDEVSRIALAAARALKIDYCGVDVIRDKEGKLFVLEVNSIPAWKGLQSVVHFDVALALADHFFSKFPIKEQDQAAIG